MKLYKTLTKDYGPYSNYKYTDFKFWLPPINDIKICERGYHYCQPEDLIGWLSDQIFEIETFGETLREDDKCVAQQISLDARYGKRICIILLQRTWWRI